MVLGKTSILRLILGFEHLSAGEVCWKGEVLQSKNYMKPIDLRGFAYVAQNTLLFPHLNVMGNVCFGLSPLLYSPQKLSDKSRTVHTNKELTKCEQERRFRSFSRPTN